MAVLLAKQFAFLPAKAESNVGRLSFPLLRSCNRFVETKDIDHHIRFTLDTETNYTLAYTPGYVTWGLRSETKTSNTLQSSLAWSPPPEFIDACAKVCTRDLR